MKDVIEDLKLFWKICDPEGKLFITVFGIIGIAGMILMWLGVALGAGWLLSTIVILYTGLMVWAVSRMIRDIRKGLRRIGL